MVVEGDDPIYMLTGVIPATAKLLARAGLSLADIDFFEVNEAFASVVLAWATRGRCRPRPGERAGWRHRHRPSAGRLRGPVDDLTARHPRGARGPLRPAADV